MKKKIAGIAAPSGNVLNLEDVKKAAKLLEEDGWEVKLGESVLTSFQRFGGVSDEARAEDFNRLCGECDFVLAARGGYGLNRILLKIDFEEIHKRGVWVGGFSDITLFSLAYLAKYQGKSLHCPTASVLGKPSVSAFSIESFRTALSSKQYAIEFETDAADLKVSGTLWGGNLSVLVSALGTPYFPDIEGGVLFLEDLAEPAYKIERNFLQLAQAEVLQKQQAIVLGHFSHIRNSAHDFGYSIEDAKEILRKTINVPVIEGLPFGHVDDLCTLVIGARCCLSVNSRHCTLTIPDAPNF